MSSLRRFYNQADRSGVAGGDRVRVELELVASIPRPAARPLRVLDLGCGDGTVTALVASQAAPAFVVGADWAWQGIEAARAKGVAAVQLSIDEGLPFRSGAFDLVLMGEVIEHLVDPDLALIEVKRLLAGGGTLVLSTPNLAAWFNRLLLLAGVQPVFSEVSRLGIFGRPGHIVVGHLRLCTSRALTELLGAHGFRLQRLAGASYHDVPVGARWLDHIFARWPSVAAILLAQATVSEVSAGADGGG